MPIRLLAAIVIGFLPWATAVAQSPSDEATQIEQNQSEQVPSTLYLTGVEFEGNAVISDAELNRVVTSFLNRRLNPSEAFAAAEAVTTAYKDAGYALSRAFIPEQAMSPSDRILKISIVEGYIDAVEFPPEVGKYRDVFSQYARKITSSRPMRARNVERYVRLMNELPGLSFKSTLRASRTNPGASTMVLSVAEKKFSGSLAIDNSGSGENGEQITLSGTMNNVLGIHDRITMAATVSGLDSENSTPEYQSTTVGYSNVLNSEGTMVSWTATGSKNKPNTGTLADLEYESLSTSTKLEISHPVYLTNKGRITLSGAIEGKNSEVKMLGNTTQEDRLRVVSAKASGQYSAFNGTSTASLEVRQGIEGLGSTNNGHSLHSRSGGTVDFTKFTLEASRDQQITGPFSVRTRGKYQFTDDSLLSAEECGYGGRQYGRAFSGSALAGDRCSLLSAEGIFQLPQQRFYSSAEAYGFYDQGTITNIASDGSRASDSASSGGVGLRAVADNISGSVEYARSIKEPSTISQTQEKVSFSATLRF